LRRPLNEYIAIGAEILRGSYDHIAQDCGFIQMPGGHWESGIPIPANAALLGD
jgi:hypothetical protein